MKKKLLPVIMSIALFASQTAVIAENTYEYVIVEEPGTEASEYNGFTDDIQDDVIESEDIFYDGNSECDIVDEIPSDENEEVIQEETDFSDIESVVSEDTEAIETEAEEIVEDDVFWDDEEIVEEEWENVDENDDEIVGDDDEKTEISIYQFPDPNFRKYVLDDIDADHDGYLSKLEREKVTKLVFDEIIYNNYGFTGKIKTLRGLELFTNLQSLTCEYTDLILLDMSKNTALKELRISNNSILNLNLTNNKELECIELKNCSISKLDLSQNTQLNTAWLEGLNISRLDLSNNSNITELRIVGNKKLTTLDIDFKNQLTELYCTGNALTSLRICNNAELKKVDCSNNTLRNIEIYNNPNLTYLNANKNQLDCMDLSELGGLESLDYSENIISSLDINNCPALRVLSCFRNNITTLNIYHCEYLKKAFEEAPVNMSDGIQSYWLTNPDRGILCDPDTTIVSDSGNEKSEYYADVPSAEIHDSFSFASLLKKDHMTYTYDYCDEWLFNDAHLYDLTKMSLRAAMASFGCNEDGVNYSGKYIESMMDSLGFLDVDVQYSKPEYNSIGTAIGLKNVKCSDGKSRTIIMLAVRSGGYGAEWGGNLHVGSAGNHEGFQIAVSRHVLPRLKNYLKKEQNNIHDELMIWISGYSRGAATANLLASELDNGAINGIGKGNVKAFCFECPQSTVDADAESSRYDNIINIVNPADIVPKVPMSKWGFKRYGKTYFLPGAEFTAKYSAYIKNVEENYNRLTDYNNVTVSRNACNLPTYQGGLFDYCVEQLAALIPRETYSTYFENGCMDLAGTYLDGDDFDDPAFIVSLLSLGNFAALYPITSAMIARSYNDGSLQYGHYPELCLAWLDSMNGFQNMYLEDQIVYKRILIDIPFELTISNGEGNIVGEIVNYQVTDIKNGVPMWINDRGQIMIILPADGSYQMNMKAITNGVVSYTVTEFDPSNGMTEKLIDHQEIEISQNDILQACITGIKGGIDSIYKLITGDQEISPSDASSANNESDGQKKKKNTLTVKAKSPTISAEEVKKKTVTIKASEVFRISKAKGKVTYKKISGSKRLTVSSNGDIKVKKGTKEGKYKLVVAVKAKGNKKYKAMTKKTTVTLEVM